MSDFRVIYHQRTCPDCGSDNITENEVDTTDGLTETALICGDCGAAWPVACIAEHLEPAAASPHLALRIDGCPPDAEPSRRRYWCPACDANLTGTDLATTPALHYTPGPRRVLTRADLAPGARP